MIWPPIPFYYLYSFSFTQIPDCFPYIILQYFGANTT